MILTQKNLQGPTSATTTVEPHGWKEGVDEKGGRWNERRGQWSVRVRENVGTVPMAIYKARRYRDGRYHLLSLSSQSSFYSCSLCTCGVNSPIFKMKAMVCALALAAVLAVANCAPYQIAYLIPVDAPVARVARAAQFSGSAANAGSQSFSAGGFPGFGGFSGSAANAASQSFTSGGGFPGHGGFSGSAASAGAQSFSGGSGFPGLGGFSGSAANAGAQSFSG